MRANKFSLQGRLSGGRCHPHSRRDLGLSPRLESYCRPLYVLCTSAGVCSENLHSKADLKVAVCPEEMMLQCAVLFFSVSGCSWLEWLTLPGMSHLSQTPLKFNFVFSQIGVVGEGRVFFPQFDSDSCHVENAFVSPYCSQWWCYLWCLVNSPHVALAAFCRLVGQSGAELHAPHANQRHSRQVLEPLHTFPVSQTENPGQSLRSCGTDPYNTATHTFLDRNKKRNHHSPLSAKYLTHCFHCVEFFSFFLQKKFLMNFSLSTPQYIWAHFPPGTNGRWKSEQH